MSVAVPRKLYQPSFRITVPNIRGRGRPAPQCSRLSTQRPLRTRPKVPAGRHSPADQLPVMLGQPWTLLDRRALSSSHQAKSWLRASNHISVTWRSRESN